jgi:hypothetical protein
VPNPSLTQPITSGVNTDKWVPPKVFRGTHTARPIQKRRTCRDNRAYVAVPFTISGQVAVQKYDKMWPADRDYWIARLTAVVGRHDENLHPADGTPGGHDLTANMHVIDKSDNSNDQLILVSNARLRIAQNHHNDAVNQADDAQFNVDDFNVHRLAAGDQLYVEVFGIGTTRPGTGLVVTAILVPIP